MAVRLDYIKRVFGQTNHLEEERQFRSLLDNIGNVPRLSTPRVMLNLAHNINRQRRYDEAEQIALEIFVLIEMTELYKNFVVERIDCMKIMSKSQYSKNKQMEAERSLREAFGMVVKEWESKHSCVPEFYERARGMAEGIGTC